MIATSGEWDRGLALLQRIMALNPHHPGWYHFPAFFNHYRKGEYEAALQVAKKIGMPEYYLTQMVVAAAWGQLNRRDEAFAAITPLRKHYPMHFDPKYCREDLEKWIPDKELVESLVEGLREAGLESPEPGASA